MKGCYYSIDHTSQTTSTKRAPCYHQVTISSNKQGEFKITEKIVTTKQSAIEEIKLQPFY